MSDSENSAAEPLAANISISLRKVNQSNKYQPTGQPHCWFYHYLGSKLQTASAEITVKQRHNHFTKNKLQYGD